MQDNQGYPSQQSYGAQYDNSQAGYSQYSTDNSGYGSTYGSSNESSYGSTNSNYYVNNSQSTYGSASNYGSYSTYDAPNQMSASDQQGASSQNPAGVETGAPNRDNAPVQENVADKSSGPKHAESKSEEPKSAEDNTVASESATSVFDASTPVASQSSYAVSNTAVSPDLAASNNMTSSTTTYEQYGTQYASSVNSPVNGGMQGMSNTMPGAPMNGGMQGAQGGMPGMNNMVQRPGARRRPRFVPKPKREEDASFVERRNLLTATASSAKHQITRERKIAGNLPDWDPLPPSEILITR